MPYAFRDFDEALLSKSENVFTSFIQLVVKDNF